VTLPYEHPQQSNVKGQTNKDSVQSSEFTFHHGHVEKAINAMKDIEDHIEPINDVPKNVSQCVIFTSTFEDPLLHPHKSNLIARPLFRGFSDSITRGDSIIYTEIPRHSKKYYYLGPLNTTNDPNYTPDDWYNILKLYTEAKDSPGGYNMNYPFVTDISKVSKNKNYDLDRPFGMGFGEIGSDVELDSNVTDLVLEGRYGNCIRFGTRFVNPYIVVANNNGAGSEGANNGSIMGLLSIGQISDYFPDFTDLSSNKVIIKGYESKESGYKGFPICAGNDKISGTVEKSIGLQDRFHIDYGSIKETSEEQTEYDQIIMFSDRITFDAQGENGGDLTMSAKRNINFGAGNNFTLTNKGFTVLESKNIYIGKSAKQRSQPMVLGEELRRLLVSILRLINDSRALVQGVPIPLMKQDSSPLLADITKIMQEFNLGMMPLPGDTPESPDPGYNIQVEEEKPLGDRTTGGATFFSNHHFIETNRS